MRSSSGCSVSPPRTGQGWKVSVPRLAAQRTAATSVGQISRADRPLGKAISAVGNPFGEVLRGPLLVEELAFDAVDEPLEGGGPVAQGAQDSGADGQEVLGHVPLGVALLRKVDLVRIGQPYGPSARVQLHRFARCCHVGHGRRGAHMAHIGGLRSPYGPQSGHGSAGDAAREADAREIRETDPARDAVRGQVGRLPGDRAPGR